MSKLLLLLSLSPLLLSQNERSSWVSTFDDEFNAADLDLSRWVPHDPFGHLHAPEALMVSGGQLHIALSGAVSTFGLFSQTYGRFEIRCRVPTGQRLRPEFRLLAVPLGPLPESEVFQTTGNAPSKVHFANRCGTEQTERSFADTFTGPDLSIGFHTLSVEWDRDRITWFVDGKEKLQSVDGVPRQPMYMLIELAGGGRVADSSSVPTSFDIDYIRVYQKKSPF